MNIKFSCAGHGGEMKKQTLSSAVDSLPPILRCKSFADVKVILEHSLGREILLEGEAFNLALAPTVTLASWIAQRNIRPNSSTLRLALIGAAEIERRGKGTPYAHLPLLAALQVEMTHVVLIGPDVGTEFGIEYRTQFGKVHVHAIRARVEEMVDVLVSNDFDAAMIFHPGFRSHEELFRPAGYRQNTMLQEGGIHALAHAGIPLGATAFVKMDALADIAALREAGLRVRDLRQNTFGFRSGQAEVPIIGKKFRMTWAAWLYEIEPSETIPLLDTD
jgi:hypothetical protein